MAGSAVVTTRASSATMKNAIEVSPSVQPRRGSLLLWVLIAGLLWFVVYSVTNRRRPNRHRTRTAKPRRRLGRGEFLEAPAQKPPLGGIGGQLERPAVVGLRVSDPPQSSE